MSCFDHFEPLCMYMCTLTVTITHTLCITITIFLKITITFVFTPHINTCIVCRLVPLEEYLEAATKLVKQDPTLSRSIFFSTDNQTLVDSLESRRFGDGGSSSSSSGAEVCIICVCLFQKRMDG